jgi:hypothetical protein
MRNTINGLFTVLAIAAFAMISAPTLSTMNVVFAENQFSFGVFKDLGIDKFFEKSNNNNNNNANDNNNNNANDNNNNNAKTDNNNNAKTDNNKDNNAKTDNNKDNNAKTDNNKDNNAKSGNSHAGEKCGANGGNTKDWYCHGTHHHCAKGQNDCELEGGRT